MSEMLKKRIASNEAKLKTLRTSATNAAVGGGAGAGAGSVEGPGGVSGSNSASIGLYDEKIEKITNNINSVSYPAIFFIRLTEGHIDYYS